MAHRYELTLTKRGFLSPVVLDGFGCFFVFEARQVGGLAPRRLELQAGISEAALACPPWSTFARDPEGAMKQCYAHVLSYLQCGELTQGDFTASSPRRFMITAERAVYDVSDLDETLTVEAQGPALGA